MSGVLILGPVWETPAQAGERRQLLPRALQGPVQNGEEST